MLRLALYSGWLGFDLSALRADYVVAGWRTRARDRLSLVSVRPRLGRAV